MGFEISSEWVRRWGVSSGLSIVDQGLTSGGSFLINLLLARWLNNEIYGAFAVAFATFLFFSGFHNVLVLEPLSVVGPAHHSGKMAGYFVAQLKVHAVLVVIFSGLMMVVAAVMAVLAIDSALVTATAASAAAVPFVLLLWLVRRMCYVVHRPAIAAWASANYFALVLAGVLLLRSTGRLSPASAFLLVGAAGMAASLLPLKQLDIFREEWSGGYSWKETARENWSYGRLLTLSFTLLWIASQAQMYLAAGLIGLGAAGTLRALQIPSLFMTQVVTAMALLVLPTMSQDFGRKRIQQMRKKAYLISITLTGMALSFVIFLSIFAKPIARVLFGGRLLSEAWLIPVLGLVPVCTAFALGFSMALRGSQRPQFDLTANLVSAPIALATALAFTKLWGLRGAAISLVVGYAVNSAVVYMAFRKWSSQESCIATAVTCASTQTV